MMTFRFPDGSLGVVSYLANGDIPFPKEYLEIFTGGRVAVLNDWRKLELVENGTAKSTGTSSARTRPPQRMGGFLSTLQSDKPRPFPTISYSVGDQASFAAVESLRSGKTVVIPPLS